MTIDDKYLKPYTDAEMLYEALLFYANNRHAFAKAISEEGYKTHDGSAPTEEEITFAYNSAQQADRLVAYAKDKVESPIIQVTH